MHQGIYLHGLAVEQQQGGEGEWAGGDVVFAHREYDVLAVV